jgi:predicted ABC-type exoprotein transport system permease subunit
MLLIPDFWRDLARFRRHGLLSRALYSLFVRRELLLWLGVAVALGYYFSGCSNETRIALIFLYLLWVQRLFASFLVQLLTPLYFGTAAFARLEGIEHWYASAVVRVSLLPEATSKSIGFLD